MSDYISNISGLTSFARVPTQVLIDPDFGPRQFLVFSVLAAHARQDGSVAISQSRIAEMCGFYAKDLPDAALVSRLISNPGYASQFRASADGTRRAAGLGPGLVELGYLTKRGQTGFNQIKQYKLFIPFVTATGQVHRPDGSITQLRLPSDRRDSDYKAKKRVEAAAADDTKAAKSDTARHLPPLSNLHAVEDAERREVELQSIAENGFDIPADDADEYVAEPESESEVTPSAAVRPRYSFHAPAVYTREDVLADIVNYNDGLELEVPGHVYTAHGIKRPTFRAGGF